MLKFVFLRFTEYVGRDRLDEKNEGICKECTRNNNY